MTTADILVKALGVTMPEFQVMDKSLDKPKKITIKEPKQFDTPEYCKFSGVKIDKGYRVVDIQPDALNDVIGMFGDNSGYVSESVGIMFKNDWHLGGIVAFEDGTLYKPMVSPESALEQGRIAWRDVIHEIKDRKEKVVILFTTDFQKRFWHKCKPGYIGSQTPVFMHHSSADVSNSFYLDWNKLLEIHNTVREIRADGFNSAKGGIATPLMTCLLTAPIKSIELFRKAKYWETILQKFRRENFYELLFACLCEGYKLK